METNEIPPDVVAAMEEAVRHALTGKGDPEVLQRIHERAEEIRAEVLRKHGVIDVGVPAIRALRDGEDE
jgi:hypothetical protein